MKSETNALPADATERKGLCLPQANWGWFVLRGVLALILGVLALFFPFNALFAFAMLFAAFAIIDGVSSLVSGIIGARSKQERWWALILGGIVSLIVGALFIVWPVLSTISYAVVSIAVIAAWAIVTGVFEVAAAIRLRKEIEGEWLLALAGLLSILFGVALPVLLALFPGATMISLAWAIGVYAVVAGTMLILLGLKLRRRQQRRSETREPAKAVA